HVAAALEAEHRAIPRQLAGSGCLGGELHRAVGERINVEVRDSGTTIERLEIGLKDEVPRILRPLEGVVAEWLIRSREGQPRNPEKERIPTRRRIVCAYHWCVCGRIAIDERKALAPFDPIDVSRSLPAGEDRSSLRCLVDGRESLFLLGAG